MLKTLSMRIIICWFGDFPKWFAFWAASCCRNPSINWLIFHDGEIPTTRKFTNIEFVKLSYANFWEMAENALGFRIPHPSHKRVCDMRPILGTMFYEWIKNWDYFGWGDLDVIYGNIMKFLTPDILKHQVIAFNRWHLTGSFTILKQDTQTRNLFDISIPNWQESLHHLLEANPNGKGHFDEIRGYVLRSKLKVYTKESFNNPLSPYTPWRDKTFRFPDEWYWKNGILTNNIDGDIEHLYLHFMHWKGGPWARQWGNAQWEDVKEIINIPPGEEEKGFRINAKGFFPL